MYYIKEYIEWFMTLQMLQIDAYYIVFLLMKKVDI